MASIILAGGHSSRLGRDKVSLVLGNDILLQRAVDRLSPLGGEIVLVLAQGQQPPRLRDASNIRTVADLYPNRGPLAGIYSGLCTSNDRHNVVVACDMPFLNTELLRYMMKIADGYDAVVPRMGRNLEPLHAIYSRSCLAPIERMLKSGSFKVSDLLSLVSVRFVGEDEVDVFDPNHLSWFNINTPSDLMRAEEILREEEMKGFDRDKEGELP